MSDPDPIYFATPADWRHWLSLHHLTSQEVWVGYYKKHTGIPSVTWDETVDEALCVGWIDGIRRRVNEEAYTIRFTPRKASSIWSGKNLTRITELIELGLVNQQGLEIYHNRKQDIRNGYSQEKRNKAVLPEEFQARLDAEPAAKEFFEQLAKSYRQNSIWWVIRAKRPATRQSRMEILIQSCLEGKKVPPLRRKGE